MKKLHLAAVAGLGLLALSATPVLAATFSGYVTANVNQRSGPSTSYPPITVIPAGAPITIYGCLDDDSWCDISWGANRGWMSAAYLQVSSNSHRYAVRGYSGIPFITFNFGSYWDSYYQNRPFFGQKSKWSNFHWQKPGMGGNPPPPPPPPPPPHKYDKYKGSGSGGSGNGYGSGSGSGGGSGSGSGGNGSGSGGNGKNYGNGQGFGHGSGKPPSGKNCKLVNGQWVCT